MKRSEIVEIAKRVRRSSRVPDIVALCDWVLTATAGTTGYNEYMRQYMKEWRKRKKENAAPRGK